MQVLHIIIRPRNYGRIIKHQQHPGERQHEKKIKGTNPCSPVEAHTHAILTDLGRQDVIKDVIRNSQ